MAWNNQGGWPGGGRGPWGSPGGSPSPQPPNLEDLIQRLQQALTRAMPSGGFGGRGLALLAMFILVVWAVTGFYRVNPDEQGVVTRFGAFFETTQPGLNYHLPWPIDAVETPKVLYSNRVDIGFSTVNDLTRPDMARGRPEESLMLTGDENIVDINFSVLWVIVDAPAYLFNVKNPEQNVKAAAESAMREVIGRSQFQSITTEGRQAVEASVQKLLQQTLDGYGAGIRITQVQMQKADPPAAVIDAFRDVQAARSDQDRKRNEAEGYANDVIPRARGEAAQIVQRAEAYKSQVVANAQGEAQRFDKILEEYKNAKDLTRLRLYYETMERVLGEMHKVIIDPQASGTGVLPFLPLREFNLPKAGSKEGGN